LENVAEQGGAVDNGSEITADVRQHHVGIGRADNCRSKEEGKLIGRKPAPGRNERLAKGVCDLHRSVGIAKALRRDYRFIHEAKNTKNGMESPSPAKKQGSPRVCFSSRASLYFSDARQFRRQGLLPRAGEEVLWRETAARFPLHPGTDPCSSGNPE